MIVEVVKPIAGYQKGKILEVTRAYYNANKTSFKEQGKIKLDQQVAKELGREKNSKK